MSDLINMVLIILGVFWAIFPFVVWKRLNQILDVLESITENRNDLLG